MAEALLKDKTATIHVKSAGIYAHEKETANVNAIKALEEKGISLHHSSERVTPKTLSWADVVLTMTHAQKDMLITTFPQYKEKIYTLVEYVTSNNSERHEWVMQRDIADPFGGNLNMYKDTLKELEKYIDDLVVKMEKKNVE